MQEAEERAQEKAAAEAETRKAMEQAAEEERTTAVAEAVARAVDTAILASTDLISRQEANLQQWSHEVVADAVAKQLTACAISDALANVAHASAASLKTQLERAELALRLQEEAAEERLVALRVELLQLHRKRRADMQEELRTAAHRH